MWLYYLSSDIGRKQAPSLCELEKGESAEKRGGITLTGPTDIQCIQQYIALAQDVSVLMLREGEEGGLQCTGASQGSKEKKKLCWKLKTKIFNTLKIKHDKNDRTRTQSYTPDTLCLVKLTLPPHYDRKLLCDVRPRPPDWLISSTGLSYPLTVWLTDTPPLLAVPLKLCIYMVYEQWKETLNPVTHGTFSNLHPKGPHTVYRSTIDEGTTRLNRTRLLWKKGRQENVRHPWEDVMIRQVSNMSW